MGGGVEAGGQMVDQRFCPRISEGEARFVMIGRKCFRVEHYVYIGGGGGETKTTIYPVSAPDFIPVDGHKTPMVIGEFNCSCLGLAGFLDARGGDLKDLTLRQFLMGQEMADKIGSLAAEQLNA